MNEEYTKFSVKSPLHKVAQLFGGARGFVVSRILRDHKHGVKPAPLAASPSDPGVPQARAKTPMPWHGTLRLQEISA